MATIANMFFFLGGITNFLLYKDGFLFNVNAYTGPYLKEHPEFLVRTMSYIGMAAVFMWVGYKSLLGKSLFQFYFHELRFKRLINFKVSVGKLLVLAAVAYSIKLILYQSGLYGYQDLASDTLQVSRLKTFQYLSSVVFLAAGFYYYIARPTNFSIFLFWCVFLLEFLFALSHGARSALVYFFGLFFLIRYYGGMRVKLIHVFAGGMLLFLVFSIGGAFKTFILEGAGSSNPVITITKFIKENKKYREINTRRLGELAYYYGVARLNFVNETAMAIDYKDRFGLSEDDPSFTYWMALAPFNAFVPSYFVLGKREPSWGIWFNRKVQRTPHLDRTSIAFSPVGYLYFLGGVAAICIGFFFYGVVLRFTHQFLFSSKSVGGLILFLALLGILYTFNTSVHSTLILLLRYTILLPFALYVVLARTKSI
jgi:hypothetical protein